MSYASNGEIRAQVQENQEYRQNLGDELARFAVEAAQRATTAEAQHTLNEDLARDGMHKPGKILRREVEREYLRATDRFKRATKAAEILLGEKAHD